MTVSLEITKEDGKWYGVMAAGQTAAGYMSGRDLNVEQPSAVALWEFKPPPEPAVASDAESSDKKTGTEVTAETRTRFESDIKSFFVSKFGHTLPVSAFGQTRLHSRLGFDHRNGVDVALNPDSSQGRALLGKLRGLGVPFITFRKPIPGIATGAHIHVGRPSPRR